MIYIIYKLIVPKLMSASKLSSAVSVSYIVLSITQNKNLILLQKQYSLLVICHGFKYKYTIQISFLSLFCTICQLQLCPSQAHKNEAIPAMFTEGSAAYYIYYNKPCKVV